MLRDPAIAPATRLIFPVWFWMRFPIYSTAYILLCEWYANVFSVPFHVVYYGNRIPHSAPCIDWFLWSLSSLVWFGGIFLNVLIDVDVSDVGLHLHSQWLHLPRQLSSPVRWIWFENLHGQTHRAAYYGTYKTTEIVQRLSSERMSKLTNWQKQMLSEWQYQQMSNQ